MFKKFASGKINGTKRHSFFFGELQHITVSLLICDSYELKHKVYLPKTVCRIFLFSIPFPFY